MSVPAFPNESAPATPGEGTTPDGLESVGADVGGGGGGGVTDEEAAEEAVTFEVMASVRRHLTSSAVARSSGVCPSCFQQVWSLNLSYSVGFLHFTKLCRK